MPLYQYQAQNNKGKTLQGVLQASDETAAQSQIEALGFYNIHLTFLENSPELPQDLVIYEYEAYDKKNRKILGTLPAKNPYFAIIRLQKEYDLEVSFVVPKGASEQEKTQAKQWSLQDYKDQYEQALQQNLDLKKSPALKAIPVEVLAHEPKLEPQPNFEPQSQANPSTASHQEDRQSPVDPILKIVKVSLERFSTLLTPEQNKQYQVWIEKLLRLKKEANHAFVHQETQSMLQEIQKLEIQLHRQELESKKLDMKKALMQELKKVSLVEIKEQAPRHQKIKKLLWGIIHYEIPFLKVLAIGILHKLPNEKELALLEEERLVDEKLFLLKKRLDQVSDKERGELEKSFHRLEENKTNIKQKRKLLALQRSKQESFMLTDKPDAVRHGFWNTPLKVAQSKEQEELQSKKASFEWIEEIHELSAWLLSFYMALYVLHFYYTEKGLFQNFFLARIPIFEWEGFQILSLGLFFSYVLLELHRQNFPNSNKNLFWILPLGFFFFSLLIANL